MGWGVKDETVSTADLRRVKLTGYLSAVCVVVSVVYAVLDTFYAIQYSYPAYSVLFIMPCFSLLMIRKKRYRLAKILLLLSVNLAVFWSALHDPFETGVYLFFIPIGIGSFVILRTREMKTGSLLLVLTTILFLVTQFSELNFVKIHDLSPAYIRISFLFNFFISLAISVSAVYFLMSLNRLAENQLIQKEVLTRQKNLELQKVNAELDSFVYRVSHDLRSPLTSILGLINLAKLTQNRQELEKIHEMIEGRIEAQDTFIREIIDYSRNARTGLTPEDVNLFTMVQQIVGELRYMEYGEHIHFKIALPDNLVIKTDKTRLRIILSNLISNGIKYIDRTKPGAVIEVGYEESTRKLYVADNGIGMNAVTLARIFDMFYRGSERSTGSGLGLFIAREAAAKIDGFIEVESVYGEGSTFKVYIPASPRFENQQACISEVFGHNA